MAEEMTLTLTGLIDIIKKRIILIIIITLAFTGLGARSFFTYKPVYQSDSSVVIWKAQDTYYTDSNGAVIPEKNDIALYQYLAQTYTEIAQSRAVADAASAKLNNEYSAGEIKGAVTVSMDEDAKTPIITISAQSGDPVKAQKIAKAVTESFVEEAKGFLPAVGNIQIKIMDEAQIPSGAINSRKLIYIPIAFFMGIIVAVVTAYGLDCLIKLLKRGKVQAN